MPSFHGILGQAAPVAGVLTTLYVMPQGRHLTVKTIVCNRGGVDVFRLVVSPMGAALDLPHYLAFDMPIAANDSLSSAPFVIGATDVVRVMSANGNISFTLSGIEEDG